MYILCSERLRAPRQHFCGSASTPSHWQLVLVLVFALGLALGLAFFFAVIRRVQLANVGKNAHGIVCLLCHFTDRTLDYALRPVTISRQNNIKLCSRNRFSTQEKQRSKGEGAAL